MTWKIVPGNLMTRWAKEVTPENAWPEYPRPQLKRDDWLNLNGLWDYRIAPREQEYCEDFEGQILVPFPIESALSGVKRSVRGDERIFTRRTFSIPKKWTGNHVLLHFGAVDWEATVWVNGKYIGMHRGGYLPFWFDITEYLHEEENEVVVAAWDPTDRHWQQRGKQVLEPKSIWYTAITGIWQTVWLEPVPERFISRIKITPDIDAGTVNVKVNLEGNRPGLDGVSITVWNDGKVVSQGIADPSTNEIILPLSNPKLWSPDSPSLYDLTVEAGEDRVTSYFGMRKFSVEAGRLCLNNRPLFQFGPLDQGYWPDGLYTPPSDEAMRNDLELVKGLGFNMLRKHVKVEPARYYASCDRLGLIVWQDMPNGGSIVGDVPTFLALAFGSRRRDANYRVAGRAKVACREDYHHELQEMVEVLYNYPCIGMWVPFNEGWGQYDAKKIASWLANYDPTRPVDHASGFYDQGGGDCKSLHVYFKKLPVQKPEKKRALVISEFGGYSLNVEGNRWNPAKEFGYKKFATREALTDAYLNLLKNELKPCIEAGLSAAIYTQTTDVEIEVNGYVTYDRAVEKMDFVKVREAHRQLLG